ncbi:hypothetical protein [Phocaeicola dorei]|jgi:hypothetical protein|uniref:hypothetical protein n=1 Tax=Phocaeicola dorei TaxID=357276 RepID=UPI001BDE2FBC|nr:hypothetical protein [Phocaeicola dorei]MBT1285850.1 hypothetical protein [Phocaeicola dorei]MBT1289718.1 hypothetical protein [Phocaeicola dorei]
MAKEKKTEVVEDRQATPAIEFINDVNVPIEVREKIVKKAEELKSQHKLRKIFIIVVEGEDGDDKPLYIAYLRRPSLMHFSQYMNFVQKDLVQANKMLATNVFLEGDRELVDDDELFLYGTMQQLSHLIDSRNADMVKQ